MITKLVNDNPSVSAAQTEYNGKKDGKKKKKRKKKLPKYIPKCPDKQKIIETCPKRIKD